MPCAVCTNKKFIPILKKDSLELLKCRNCGLVQVKNLSLAFNPKNYEYYCKRQNFSRNELYNPITEKRYQSLLRSREPYRKYNRLLDIGCGEGHFLHVAKKMGWNTRGLDASSDAVKICEKFGIEAECANLPETGMRDNYYDIVTMFEVVEHLASPKEYLHTINRILRKGGALLLTTPNFGSLMRILLHHKWTCINEGHLLYFTPRTIKKLIKESDFSIINLKTKNISLPELMKIFKPSVKNIYRRNQGLRSAIEEISVLSNIKADINKILNAVRLGETIECMCRKQ